nr:hypothetical protein [Pseudanabaena sp. 'Roaring Creek']
MFAALWLLDIIARQTRSQQPKKHYNTSSQTKSVYRPSFTRNHSETDAGRITVIVKVAIANTLDNISPEILSHYLRARGWKEVGDFLGNASIWHQGDDLEVILPKSPQLRDYKNRIREIIDVLEISEHRDRQQIVNDLLLKPTDLIKIRIDSPDIIGGTIPIDEAVRLFEATSKIMKFAASATLEQRSIFRGGMFAQVREYLQELRVGETEQGSYIINVLSPIMHDHEDFGRKVNISLNTAIAAIRAKSQEVLAGSNIEIFEQAVSDGVSANLCDALLEVGSHTDLQDLGFRWQWSPIWNAPSSIHKQLALPKETFPVLEEASKLLKQNNILRKPVNKTRSPSPYRDLLTLIEGEVIGLHRRDRAADANVTILTNINGSKREVMLKLNEAYYRNAVRAHLDNHKIAFYGQIIDNGSDISIQSIQDFRVVL